MTSKQPCSYEEKTISHGAEACSVDVCLACDDGNLVIAPEMRAGGEDLLADPAEAYFTPL